MTIDDDIMNPAGHGRVVSQNPFGYAWPPYLRLLELNRKKVSRISRTDCGFVLDSSRNDDIFNFVSGWSWLCDPHILVPDICLWGSTYLVYDGLTNLNHCFRILSIVLPLSRTSRATSYVLLLVIESIKQPNFQLRHRNSYFFAQDKHPDRPPRRSTAN